MAEKPTFSGLKIRSSEWSSLKKLVTHERAHHVAVLTLD